MKLKSRANSTTVFFKSPFLSSTQSSKGPKPNSRNSSPPPSRFSCRNAVWFDWCQRPRSSSTNKWNLWRKNPNSTRNSTTKSKAPTSSSAIQSNSSTSFQTNTSASTPTRSPPTKATISRPTSNRSTAKTLIGRSWTVSSSKPKPAEKFTIKTPSSL